MNVLAITEAVWITLVGNAALPLWAGLFSRPRPIENGRPSCTVVLPAWNEGQRLTETLRALEPELQAQDRVIVVADNCTDDTAAIARRWGRGEVTERRDAQRLGKAWALQHVIEYLRGDPPRYIVFLDADCRLAKGSLSALVGALAKSGQPQQAAYRLSITSRTSAPAALSALAFSWMNEARPYGRRALGLPCGLYGSGMALSWQHLAVLPEPRGSLVEDRQWTIDLAFAGHAPRFCPEARVESPADGGNWIRQHQRWERGALKVLGQQAPRLLGHALRHPTILPLALDQITPPTTLSLALGIPFLLWGTTSARAALLFWMLGLALTWWRWRPEISPWRILRALPGWLLGKAKIYRTIATDGAGREWQRDRAS